MTDEAEDTPPEKAKTIDELVESFVGKLRSGERPSIELYQKQHPELADEIGPIFRSLAMLEQCRPTEEDQTPRAFDADDVPPNRLGDYRVIREIGRGGMGIVYEAEHDKIRRRVALKVLPKSLAQRASNLARFDQEARSAGQLHHTNIVPVFDVGEHDGFHYYAMQFIRGENLDLVIDEVRSLRASNATSTSPSAGNEDGNATKLLGDDDSVPSLSQSVAVQLVNGQPLLSDDGQESPKQSAGKTPNSARDKPTNSNVFDSSEWSVNGASRTAYFRRAAAIGLQVADALAYAHHNRVLHRDIKPSNLILDTEGIVWITDFGLAKGDQDGDGLTQTGDIVGTLKYMAPERFHGQTDQRSDIYSLGLALYELCTLKNAFENTDRASLVQQVTERTPPAPRTIEPTIPRDLETIILKAIDRSPDRRYRSARRLANDLEAFLTDHPIKARRASAIERTWRLCRRNPVTASLAAASVLLLVTVAVGSSLFAFRLNRQAQQLKTQHRRASSHLELTEQTIERMLDRVANELRDVPQMGQVREELLKEALELQHQILDLEKGNSTVRQSAVAAHFRMAEIQHLMHRTDDATDSARLALELAKKIDGELSEEDRFQQSRTLTFLASLHRDQNEFEKAERYAQLSIDLYEVAPGGVDDVHANLQLIDAIRQLGAIQQQTGRIEQAIATLQQALDVLGYGNHRINELDPGYFFKTSEVLNSLAIAYRGLGQFAECENCFLECIDLIGKLEGKGLGTRDSQDQLGIVHHNLGNVYLYQEKHDAAAKAYEKAFSTFSKLELDFPHAIRFQERAARSTLTLASIKAAMDDFKAAESLYRQTIDTCRAIDDKHGSTTGSLDTQSVAINNLGNLLLRQDRVEEAVELLEQGIVIREQMAAGDSMAISNRRSLAKTRILYAKALENHGQLDRAIDELETAYTESLALFTDNREDPRLEYIVSNACNNMCDALTQNHSFNEVIEWAKRLANTSPDNPRRQGQSALKLTEAFRELDNASDVSDEQRALRGDLSALALDYLERALSLGLSKDEVLVDDTFLPLSEFERFRELGLDRD